EIPGGAAVAGDPEPAVLADHHVLGVPGVDPQRVVVAVDVARAAQALEGRPGVVRDLDPRHQVVDAVRPRGIDPEVGVVEGPLGVLGVVVDRLPGAAAVARADDGALLRLDDGVDGLRRRGRDGDADAAQLALGQPVVGGPAGPGGAAVVGD